MIADKQKLRVLFSKPDEFYAQKSLSNFTIGISSKVKCPFSVKTDSVGTETYGKAPSGYACLADKTLVIALINTKK